MLHLVAALVVLGNARGGTDRLARTPTDADESGRVSVSTTNDAFSGGSNNDYTNGWSLEVQLTSSWLKRLLPAWNTGRSFLGFEMGQTIYTPLDLREDRGDFLRLQRPYAGWLFFGPTAEWRFDQGPGWKNHPSGVRVELLMGPVGSRSGAGATQRRWHSILRGLTGNDTPVAPAGWDVNQVTGTFGANLFTSIDTELLQPDVLTVEQTRSKRTGSAFGIRIGSSLSFAAGNVLDMVALAPIVRIGLVSTTGHIATATPPVEGESSAVSSAKKAEARPTLPTEFYAFSRVEGRWVIYDALLQRDTEYRGTEVTIHGSTVKKRSLVGEFELGAVLRIGPMYAAYGWIIRSAEASAPFAADRRHGFGRLDLAFSW